MLTLMYLCILASRSSDLTGIKLVGLGGILVLDIICVMQTVDYFYRLTLG